MKKKKGGKGTQQKRWNEKVDEYVDIIKGTEPKQIMQFCVYVCSSKENRKCEMEKAEFQMNAKRS